MSSARRGVLGRARAALAGAREFATDAVWAVRLEQLGTGKALLYRTVRVLHSTYVGFTEKRLTFRAAALTYFSVLSVVPFLAFAFSVLKGFGAYDRLIAGAVLPYLREAFGQNPALLGALEQLLGFVERTNVSSLGVGGVLFLAYASISLLATVETALNDIWGAKSRRRFVRQVTDYTTILVITPLLVLAAITFATAAQSSGVVLFLRENLALGAVIDFLLKLTSVVLGCVAMVALYLLMPNVSVRFSSALIGGVVGGLLWQLALFLYVNLQSGVARYNALYAGFAAIPIFLVWLYTSWLTVLVGAQIAASQQLEKSTRQAMRARHVDQALTETLAVAVAGQVARRFIDGGRPITEAAIAGALEVPPPTVERVVDRLVTAAIVLRVIADREVGYSPARDLDQVRLADLRRAMRCDPAATEIRRVVEGRLEPGLRELLEQETAAQERAVNPTLREIADLVAPPQSDGSAERHAPLFDAKQPEVPA